MLTDEAVEQARQIVDGAPCQVVLPAGCGKTQLAANTAAVVVERGGRVLVLTHTHAAVDAVRRRLRFLGIPKERANVTTIAAWFGSLVKAYPVLSGVVVGEDVEYDAVDSGALKLFSNAHIRRVLAASYDLLIVDEYQDCNVGQHAAIAAVRDVVPAVVFGDPLQVVLNYRGNELIDWDSDLADMPVLELEVVPWRWVNANPQLGAFTLDLRAAFLSGQSFDLAGAPVEWCAMSNENVRRAMFASRKFDGSTVVLRGGFRPQALSTAKQVGGLFGLMEEVEGKRLVSLASVVDAGDGYKSANALVEFAADCFCHMSGLKTRCKDVANGSFPAFRQGGVLTDALTALKVLAEDPTTDNLLAAMDVVARIPGVTLVCREAWYGVKEAATIQSRDPSLTLSEAVQRVRDRVRRYGRYPEQRVVSRIPLFKGLQCGRCIAVLPDNATTAELYVALTRATHELVVVSGSAMVAGRTD